MEYKNENKIDSTNSVQVCQNCKKDFTIEPDDFGFYEKMNVPPPTFCPECRLIRRLAWRNERSLYNRECSLCKKKIVSIYNEELSMPVYCEKCWWGDGWDSTEYGAEYDFSRPFFVQLFELRRRVPALNLFSFMNINSPYCNMTNDFKNCYLVHDGTFSENVSYGSGVFSCKESQDLTMTRKCELCYELVTCINCYQTFFSQNCVDCVDVYFSHSLRNCNNCFGCTNLAGKSYCIFNEQYTKEEYEKKLKSFNLDSQKNIISLKEKIHDFWKKFPKKYYFGVRNVNVSGDYLENSKNAKECFGAANLEDSKFCSFVSNGPVRTTYDFSHYGDNIELAYECLQCGDGVSNIRGGWGVWTSSRNVNYCITSPGVSDVFGCVALKKKKYCILNKQYTKEEYGELFPKIIKHMNDMPYVDKEGRIYKYGEFFPFELSLFGYNETTAYEYFPLTKEQALEKGYRWCDKAERGYSITKKPENIPDSITDVDDSILGEVVACEHSGKCNENCMTAFRISAEDLKFHRRLNLPLPRLCPNCRHYQRVELRNPLKLWHRKCMNKGCQNEFETSYAPERPEIIYCEKCYNKEVY